MSDSHSPGYYITTPIYYVNGLPHVGSGLTTIACDVLARYHRMRGYNTWFLTGTDENATKVQEAAQKAGVPTQDFVDGLSADFELCWKHLHIENDDFIRTTEARHVRAVQEFFQRLRDRGYIYLDSYEGWYSVSDETFFRDNEVKDGVAIESGKPVVRAQEQNYFFKLSAFGDRLLQHIEHHPGFLQPEFRKNEVISFINEGLRDMSITRPYRGWGIQVPGDEANYIYVWFDALINYLAACGWPDNPNWVERWPAALHLMGKEIFVRFHATLWPAMLMALDMPLPETIFAHGWWTLRGIEGKPGKSTGGLPHPSRFSDFIAARSGADHEIAVDAQRYLLCREMNFGWDTDFSVENCLRRFNTDLANDLGNLMNCTVNMVVKYFDGIVPVTQDHDHEIAALALRVEEEYVRAIAEHRLNVALEHTWQLVARMNKYIDERAPWALAKAATAGDEAAATALSVTLYACLEVIRIVSVLVAPFMPVASESLRKQIGIGANTAAPSWGDLKWGGLAPGTRVLSPVPLFPRIQELAVDETALIELCGNGSVAADTPNPIERLGNELLRNELLSNELLSKENRETVSENQITHSTGAAPQGENAPVPGAPVPPTTSTVADVVPTITIDDFMKVELRIAEVLAAEPVPNSTKLLRLTVQLGDEDTRTVLAGIAEYYSPDELVGRQVVLVANLLPRKMRGIESQGMLLAADGDGRAILLQPDRPAPGGARVR